MMMQCVATTIAQKHVIRDDKWKWDTLPAFNRSKDKTQDEVEDKFDW